MLPILSSAKRLKWDKGLKEQPESNRSFRELYFGVLNLLHTLLLTCYTRYTFLLSAL